MRAREGPASEGETTLKDAKDSLTLPDLREQIDVQLKKHKQMESYYTEEAKNRSAVLGKPAPTGRPRTSKARHIRSGYKGKVVILTSGTGAADGVSGQCPR